MKKQLVPILLIAVILAGVWYFSYEENKTLVPVLSPIAQVTYLCNDGKMIDAAFYKRTSLPVAPGEPPIPTGSVEVILSDGRNFKLPQTISADGARYATSDESLVFWSKGNGALVLEHNVEKSYIGCVVVAKDPGGLPNVYADGEIGFSIRYPAEYSANASHVYQALGPGKDIHGVKFTISSSSTAGTNLSGFDTGVSVEAIPAVQSCTADLFVDGAVEVRTVAENGGEYSFASTTQGAAGNRYEELVWAFPGTNPCIAVRYFLHSTNIENYPEGAVSAFDRTALMGQFEKMRHSLTVR